MNPATICPTVTAYDTHQYRQQMELLEVFAKRIHIDLMDGQFLSKRSPSLDQIWWPEQIAADLHLMYQRPGEILEQVVKLKPSLAIIHLEADVDHAAFAAGLHAAGIKAGLGLLQDSTVAQAAPLLDSFDHAMIFSGKLGYHGGEVDFSLSAKAEDIRRRWPSIEVAWDGGVNDQNARQLVTAGASVLNVGSYIHQAADPAAAYAKLESVIRS